MRADGARYCRTTRTLGGCRAWHCGAAHDIKKLKQSAHFIHSTNTSGTTAALYQQNPPKLHVPCRADNKPIASTDPLEFPQKAHQTTHSSRDVHVRHGICRRSQLPRAVLETVKPRLLPTCTWHASKHSEDEWPPGTLSLRGEMVYTAWASPEGRFAQPPRQHRRRRRRMSGDTSRRNHQFCFLLLEPL